MSFFGHCGRNIPLFRTVFVFDASPFEKCNVDIKQAYKHFSQRSNTCVFKTVNIVEHQLDNLDLAILSLNSETESKDR